VKNLAILSMAFGVILVASALTVRAEDKPKGDANKPTASRPTSQPAETFTGTVESTHTQKRPRLVVHDTHYELKPSDNAPASVKETLAKISSGEATGTYTVKGTATTIDSRKWILIDSITKVNKDDVN
jgi:hypothetical protein